MGDYDRVVSITAKGLTLDYDALCSFMSIIDLAENDLYVCIPHEIGNLKLLHDLNLSGNHLREEITDKIGLMNQLESLDLSRNHGLFVPQTAIHGLFVHTQNRTKNEMQDKGKVEIGGMNRGVPPVMEILERNLVKSFLAMPSLVLSSRRASSLSAMRSSRDRRWEASIKKKLARDVIVSAGHGFTGNSDIEGGTEGEDH
ncbi:putative receptor like protein 25 [Dioscorea cayenensis subsp. rotundata]|uniref:Receptor like protein 25 n=1 Tax=Dioscorea cayennensis subsp. rotundata TaxID=55577 RepID=A0AB40CFN6_DIOCR|nr:putative receptor like protein 25 [Dioscorea cayenensis subsp. rotundata]